jgi:hypothetical protein
MKKAFILFTLFSFFVAKSQNEKAIERSRKIFETSKSKPLYVVLDVENEKYLNKLTKKGKTLELENYKKLISTYNATVKKAVEKYLNIFPSIKYITTTELKELKTKDFKTINLLLRTFPTKLQYSSNASFNSVSGASSGGFAWTESKIENLDIDTNNVNENSIIEFRTYLEDDMLPLYNQPLSKLFCTSGEIYYAVRQLSNTFKEAAIQNSSDKNKITEKANEIINGLKTRTLIVNENDLKSGLTENDIKTVYPYAFKIVKLAEFNEELTKKNESILILIPVSFPISSVAGIGRTHTIYDSNTENVYRPNVKKCEGEIEKKHFEYYYKPL